jgi:adenosylcobinamide-phosphate synthase
LLGGPAWYHGALEHRPALGRGRAPQANDIERALKLIDRSLAIWLIALGGGMLLVYSL